MVKDAMESVYVYSHLSVSLISSWCLLSIQIQTDAVR